ncbi:MAG: DUF3368 domain-containing protein [Anaerolineae bacterium]|nr:DUF3368 domain-containing protein [Anaerolineae bacterium]
MPVPQRVVSNTTPLIALASIQQLDLLPSLFGRIMVPSAVAEELAAAGTEVPGAAALQATWIQVVPVNDMRIAEAFPLDKGEAETLALAIEQNAELVIADERLARRQARRLGLPLTGTLGILLLAKEQGLITLLRPQVESLLSAGIWLDPELVRAVLTQGRE